MIERFEPMIAKLVVLATWAGSSLLLLGQASPPVDPNSYKWVFEYGAWAVSFVVFAALYFWTVRVNDATQRRRDEMDAKRFEAEKARAVADMALSESHRAVAEAVERLSDKVDSCPGRRS